MKHYVLTLAMILAPLTATAEPYPSTLSVEEQERHEFFDVQKENYPSGPTGRFDRPLIQQGDDDRPLNQQVVRPSAASQ
ncbi:hypothetical protein [Xanthobacter autotrophicus]|uniref:hypothetical protein n=1 Tax=Xanthobacter autotrophicus TaxID=280 RepID=UPI003728724C